MHQYESAEITKADAFEPGVDALADGVEKALAVVRERLSVLQDRIEPILRPDQGANVAADRGDKDHPRSPFATRLIDMRRRVEQLDEWVTELTARVDI